ncbi:hypothetical protein C8Q77DRAFT_93307 [Trametes polyzona]|nr:hypothetical protein C8Q77DRAFT_93307 [Trametes polyzona]
MFLTRHSCETSIPAKRPVPSDFEPLRISRSMAAEDPYSRNLLISNHSPPPMPTSTRRRVNPESLAVRLGPELVKELESYVKPGVVEMPSFAIRQQIQKRHKVDRRHIYDWFHSKGLRVTKEDKRATVEQKTDAMRMQRRIRRSIAPAIAPANVCPSLGDAGTDSAPSSPDLLTPPVIASEFRPCNVAKRDLLASLDHHNTVKRKYVDVQAAKSATPATKVSTIETPSANRVLHQMTSALNLPPPPPPGYTRKFRDPHIDSVFPIDENAWFDQAQRETCYNTLSRVLGPADGFQECVGTYKAHMDRQLGIYYQDFLPECTLPLDANSVASAGDFSDLAPRPEPELEGLRQDGSIDSIMSTDPTQLWDALNAALGWTSSPWAFEGSSVVDTAEPVDLTVSAFDCLALDDILASAVLEPERPKAITFSSDSELLSHSISGAMPPPNLPFFGNSSSSLAGALGDAPVTYVHDMRRKTKDWTRPRMGRARAYSAGGGM